MPKDNSTTTPSAAFSETAAKVSFAAAALFLVLLVALHFIKPELEPSWRMISEYEIGRYGWMMQGAFLSLAVSDVALCIAILSEVRTVGGRIGLVLLLLSAIGSIIGGIFTTDPITASKDLMTTHGNLHGLGFLLGAPSFPIAAVLISVSLGRNQAWLSARRSLLWTAHLTWISLLVLGVLILVLLPQNGGKFGSNVIIGWPNRFFVVAESAWLILVAWRAIKLRRQKV